MDLNDAVKCIRRFVGTEVKLTVLREGKEIEFKLKRARKLIF